MTFLLADTFACRVIPKSDDAEEAASYKISAVAGYGNTVKFVRFIRIWRAGENGVWLDFAKIPVSYCSFLPNR